MRLQTLIPPPIVTGLLAGCMWWLAGNSTKQAWQAPLAIILVVLGFGLMLAAVVEFVKARTTVNPMRPNKTRSLIVTGVFAFTRNPIYLGDVFVLLAVGAWLGTFNCLAATALFVWYINEFQIKPEEQALSAKFGESYRAYSYSVRRWF
jgi:protein-S-isoprenylcysteine O-methyltransferase Ste14